MFGSQHFAPATFIAPSWYDRDAVAYYNYVLSNGGIFEVTLSELNAAIIDLKQIKPRNEIAAAMDLKYLGIKTGNGTGTTADRALQRIFYFGEVFGYLEQNTASAQALLLRWNSQDGNFGFIPGVVQNFISTPNAAANQITGDIDIKAKLNLVDWTPPLQGIIAAKRDLASGAVNTSYSFVINTDGTLNLRASLTGGLVAGQIANSTAAVPFANNTIGYVRVTRQASSGDVNFYTSSDGVTWDALGTTQSTTAGNMFNSTEILTLGNYPTASSVPLNGNIYWCSLSNVIGGAATVYFDANDYDISGSQNSLVSSATGETWTVNRGPSTTGYKSQIVYKTTSQGDGIDDVLTAALATPIVNTQYVICDQVSWKLYGTVTFSGGVQIFQTGATPSMVSTSGGGAISFTGESLQRLSSYVVVNNGASPNSYTYYNNGGKTTGNGAIATGAAIQVFSDNTNYGNYVFNTWIIAKSADSDVTVTAMYNLTRSWNGNPA